MAGVDEEEFRQAAGRLIAAHQVQGRSVREKSLAAYGSLAKAHMLAVGAISKPLFRHAGRYGLLTEKTERKSGIIAGFVCGIGICESAISEGYYMQAAALLRQEMEAMAALEEIEQNRRQERRTPNVANVRWSLGRFYDELSKATHMADHSIVETLLRYRGVDPEAPENSTAWLMSPQFDAQIARQLYGVHIALLIQLAEHVGSQSESLHGEALEQDELAAIGESMAILVSEGILVTSGGP